MNNNRKTECQETFQNMTFEAFNHCHPELFSQSAYQLLDADVQDRLSDNVYQRRPSFGTDSSHFETAEKKVFYFPHTPANNDVLSIEITHSQHLLIILDEQVSVRLNFKFAPQQEITRICEIFLAPESSLEITEQHNSSFPVMNTVFVRQRAYSHFQNLVVSLGGHLVNRHKVIQAESGAESHLYGITIAGEKDCIKHHTILQHQVPHGNSFEHYKTVASGNAAVDFLGQIYVAPNAQQIEAYQQNNNILLSDSAQVTAKPQLEIYADDVKCSHGATFGQLDEEALYYMRQRGIPSIEAQKLLTGGFVTDLTGKISDLTLREEISRQLTERINQL